MAEELRRLEGQLQELLDRPPPELPDCIPPCPPGNGEEPGEPYTFPPGQYVLVGPCEEGQGGQVAEPFVASWPGGQGEILEVRRRIDALAELIQGHKLLRQPVCRTRAPIGEEVTVSFSEVL